MLERLKKEKYKNKDEELELLETILKENFDGFCYDLHKVFRGKELPRTKKIVENLVQKGFQASETQYKSWQIRTNANVSDVIKCNQQES
jgi:tRNA G26 N,N-dimethylase Trm1